MIGYRLQVKWGWDHQWAREVKGIVRFLCLKTHSCLPTGKGEQVKCNSWPFPSGCDWTFSSTPRHPRDTSLVVCRQKSCASLTIYVNTCSLPVVTRCTWKLWPFLLTFKGMKNYQHHHLVSEAPFFVLKRNLAALLLLVAQNSSE